ncbi:3-oxoacyl-ACP reductase FabG [Cytophagaceae bacterium ABcell3]|nr:3-oxoacyl-ACP reductase FabG [Cytophagaceae bacterium ABcell3]
MSADLKNLAGKIAIVTGGADGIGKKAVEFLAGSCDKVVIWDIDEEKGQKLAEELGKDNVMFCHVDTTKYVSVEEAAKVVFGKFGRIDVLINNAGITRCATLTKMTTEQWQQIIDVNLTGVFNCTKVVASYMVQGEFGRIINVCSLAGIYGSVGQTNYSATKSGVIGITKVWARELSKHNITVNVIAPGFIETKDMHQVPEKSLKTIKNKIPVGRLGKPEDVANAYLFLISDLASYITGSVINVDGGYVL